MILGPEVLGLGGQARLLMAESPSSWEDGALIALCGGSRASGACLARFWLATIGEGEVGVVSGCEGLIMNLRSSRVSHLVIQNTSGT